MKTFYLVLSTLAICLFSSFNELSEACEYAGSNITYVKNQTELAIEADDGDADVVVGARDLRP